MCAAGARRSLTGPPRSSSLAAGSHPRRAGSRPPPVLRLGRFSRLSTGLPARPGRGRPPPPRRRQLRPHPPGPAAPRPPGGEGAGKGDPLPVHRRAPAFPGSPNRTPSFPLGEGLIEQLALAQSPWTSATKASSASSTVKWGQAQLLCGAETRTAR